MARMQRSYWSIDVRYDPGWGGLTVPFSAIPAPPLILLTVRVTVQQAHQLSEELLDNPRRGTPTFEFGLSSSMTVRGIEITENEANRISNGEDPLEVVLGTWPACGYRLRAVPADIA